jgi:hyaluronoglucosaminidase
MISLGVIECFYGLPWSKADREGYARFLKDNGYEFYIYGPKCEAVLREHWDRPFSAGELLDLRTMRSQFKQQGLRFGLILSPQRLYENWDLASRRKLQDKVNALDDLGLDFLGLFFDDMKTAPDMAQKQIEIAQCVETCTQAKILFCPSYYSMDSLLDVMFGDRPHLYLETLGQGLNRNIEIVWTGEEIISKEISAAHLQMVQDLIKRKPFICDNFFANDGPLNSCFLRLLPLQGRSTSALQRASGWAFNPMNQAYLSRIVLRSAAQTLLSGQEAEQAFFNSLRDAGAPSTADLLLSQWQKLCADGLDSVSNEDKSAWRSVLAQSAGPLEREILQWLDGHYTIGIEALLKQSGFE